MIMTRLLFCMEEGDDGVILIMETIWIMKLNGGEDTRINDDEAILNIVTNKGMMMMMMMIEQ